MITSAPFEPPVPLAAWEEASLLRALILTGMRQVDIAQLFRVSQPYISIQSKVYMDPARQMTPEEREIVELKAKLDAVQQRAAARVKAAIPWAVK